MRYPGRGMAWRDALRLPCCSVADAGAGGTELNLALSSLSTGAALPLPQAQFAETVQRAVAAGAAVAELD